MAAPTPETYPQPPAAYNGGTGAIRRARTREHDMYCDQALGDEHRERRQAQQRRAALLAPGPGNDARLRQWIADARAADLPHVHSFTRGLDLDIQAATAALTMPHHNGHTEGVNF
jgi:hypothetical protein